MPERILSRFATARHATHACRYSQIQSVAMPAPHASQVDIKAILARRIVQNALTGSIRVKKDAHPVFRAYQGFTRSDETTVCEKCPSGKYTDNVSTIFTCNNCELGRFQKNEARRFVHCADLGSFQTSSEWSNAKSAKKAKNPKLAQKPQSASNAQQEGSTTRLAGQNAGSARMVTTRKS